MKKAALILALLVIAAALVAGGLYLYVNSTAETPIEPGNAQIIEFEVERGSSLDRVGAALEREGLISNLKVWKAYIRLNEGHSAKAGRHPLSRGMSMIQILEELAKPPLPDDVPVTIVEGLRIRDVDAALAAEGWIEAGSYVAWSKRLADLEIPFETDTLEGYLLPETYMVKRSEKPLNVQALIQRQLDAFRDRFLRPNAAEIEKSGRTLRDLVVMASMLEKEEPKPKVRPKVAGILYKRLDNDWALGVDATSRYTLADWSDRKAFLAKLRDPEDPYNTRLRKGLPPTAIGAPSLPSLEAALRPVESPYWYYLHDKDGTIRFGRNAQEHENNRKKYNVY